MKPSSNRFAAGLLAGTVLAAGLVAALAIGPGAPALAEDAKPAAAADAAPDPARLAAAKELLNAMGGLDQAKSSIPQFVEALAADIQQRDDKIAAPAAYFLRSETEPGKPRVKSFIAEVEATATKFYAQNFTVDEMKVITAFHTSAAGKKFQGETPKLVALMSPIMGRFQQSLIEDMQKGLSGGVAKEAAPAAAAPAAGDKK